MTKVELEAKVGALTDQINFLRAIYEEVGAFPGLGWMKVRRGDVAQDPAGGWVPMEDLCGASLGLLCS